MDKRLLLALLVVLVVVFVVGCTQGGGQQVSPQFIGGGCGA